MFFYFCEQSVNVVSMRINIIVSLKKRFTRKFQNEKIERQFLVSNCLKTFGATLFLPT